MRPAADSPPFLRLANVPQAFPGAVMSQRLGLDWNPELVVSKQTEIYLNVAIVKKIYCPKGCHRRQVLNLNPRSAIRGFGDGGGRGGNRGVLRHYPALRGVSIDIYPTRYEKNILRVCAVEIWTVDVPCKVLHFKAPCFGAHRIMPPLCFCLSQSALK